MTPLMSKKDQNASTPPGQSLFGCNLTYFVMKSGMWEVQVLRRVPQARSRDVCVFACLANAPALEAPQDRSRATMRLALNSDRPFGISVHLMPWPLRNARPLAVEQRPDAAHVARHWLKEHAILEDNVDDDALVAREPGARHEVARRPEHAPCCPAFR